MPPAGLFALFDLDRDGELSTSEIVAAGSTLLKLDKNADGKLTRDEAGLPPGFGRGPGGPGGPGGRGGREGEAARGREGGRPGGAGAEDRNFEVPIPGPTADELLATLLTFDKNNDGKLSKTEIPERQQGILDRGDTDKNGVLDAAELRKLTADQAAAPPAPPVPRGPGRGGFGGLDLASTALDADRNGEISGEEMTNAATTLKVLDKNNDGSITEDEVQPGQGRGRGL